MPLRVYFAPVPENTYRTPLSGYIQLSWTASVSAGVTEYRVYRSPISGGPYSLIQTLSPTQLTYNDFTIGRGFPFYYVVQAFDGTSESASSNEATATV